MPNKRNNRNERRNNKTHENTDYEPDIVLPVLPQDLPLPKKNQMNDKDFIRWP